MIEEMTELDQKMQALYAEQGFLVIGLDGASQLCAGQIVPGFADPSTEKKTPLLASCAWRVIAKADASDARSQEKKLGLKHGFLPRSVELYKVEIAD